MFSDAPGTFASCWEESNIARSEPMFFAVCVQHKRLAGQEMDRLILGVMPSERSWRAVPSHNRGTPVAARHKLVHASPWVTLQNPVGRYRIGLEFCKAFVHP